MKKILTPRQCEILSLASKGMTAREISAHCFLEIKSVYSVFSSAYKRLNIKHEHLNVGKMKAIEKAQALGLI